MSRLTDLRNLHARVAYEIEVELARERGRAHGMGPAPDPAVVRAWARNNGMHVGTRGRLPRQLLEAYLAHCRIGLTS